jgi:hypothetical protein
MLVLVKTLVPLRTRGYPWSWKQPWYPLGGVYEGVAAAVEVEVVVVEEGATLEVEVVDADEAVEEEDAEDEATDEDDELELLEFEAGAETAWNKVIL